MGFIKSSPTLGSTFSDAWIRLIGHIIITNGRHKFLVKSGFVCESENFGLRYHESRFRKLRFNKGIASFIRARVRLLGLFYRVLFFRRDFRRNDLDRRRLLLYNGIPSVVSSRCLMPDILSLLYESNFISFQIESSQHSVFDFLFISTGSRLL